MSKNKDRMILVTGATGHQGGAVLRHLHARGFSTRAMTRDPQSEHARALSGHATEVVKGEFDDRDSLTRALDGVYGAYSVQDWQGGEEQEVRQGVAFAEAAMRAEIDHLVYSSVMDAGKHTGIPHFDSKAQVEERVRQTGVPYTILRPVMFMDNFLAMRQQIEAGTFAFPLSAETPLQLVATDDIGAFAALAFEHGGHWHNRVIELAGDERTMTEIVQSFSRVTGREVKYQQAPWDQFEGRAGEEMTKMFHYFQDHGLHADIAARREEYPNLMSFDRWLDTHWNATAKAGS